MNLPADKDFWSGVMFLAFAGVAVLEARGYPLGTAARMGPAYFPTLLGAVLALLGAVLVARSLLLPRERVAGLRLLPLVVLTSAVLLFGIAIEKLGLVLSLAAVTAISALASREVRPAETAALVAVVTALSLAIFVYGLRLPLPVWPSL